MKLRFLVILAIISSVGLQPIKKCAAKYFPDYYDSGSQSYYDYDSSTCDPSEDPTKPSPTDSGTETTEKNEPEITTQATTVTPSSTTDNCHNQVSLNSDVIQFCFSSRIIIKLPHRNLFRTTLNRQNPEGNILFF